MFSVIPRRLSALHRLILITVLITGFIVLSITALTHFAVLSNIRVSEKAAALDSADRLVLLLEGETDTLKRIAFEWGIWTATWEYLNGTNPDFISNNIDEPVFGTGDLSGIHFYDLAGSLKCGAELDSNNHLILYTTNTISHDLMTDGLIGPAAMNSSHKGLFISGDQIYLIATHPILKNDGSGPPQGTLVAIEVLDNAAVDRLAQYMPGPIALNPAPSDQSASGSLNQHNSVPLVKFDDELGLIATDTIVPDILGRPVVQVHTMIPSREPYSSTLIIALLVIIMSGLVLLITGLYYGFSRFFLVYIKEIGEGLERVAVTGHQTEYLSGDLPPELNPLAGSATRIICTLEDKHSQLMRSEQERKAVGIRWETLFNAASELILIGDDEGILTANPRFLELTGLAHDDLIGSPVSDLPFRILDSDFTSLGDLWESSDSPGKRFLWQIWSIGYEASAEPIILDADIRFVDIDGRQLRFLIARDITEEMRLRDEQEHAILQIDKNIAQLAALNDEIRNPLMQIMGWTELDGPVHQKEILEGVLRIDAIVHRIDIGFVESEKVRAFLHRSIEGFRLSRNEKNTAHDAAGEHA
ncbi:MAG TPA: CHASE4 domain-containing protein [Methanospirillum sp.]|nr:CHASE4 domain-containing protein [Methanospirillum sp.]